MKKFKELAEIAALLRSPEGCPWDREQTIASMYKHLESESAEVLQAIEKGDMQNLQEELGDLLFLILMIAEIAREDQHFDLEQVLGGIIDKVKRRHTWVFGDDKVSSAQEAVELWKKNKAKEKQQ
jgi:tetrapyrrole methylase family protein/MazG family protein